MFKARKNYLVHEVTTGQAGETTKSWSSSRGSGHGSGYASGSTG